MGGPIPPAEYDGERLDTDEKLEAAGWAAGLDVWSVLDKVLGEAVRNGTVANAQLWSLREAVRAEHLAELGATNTTSGGVELTDELMERLAAEAERGYDVSRLRPIVPRADRQVACGLCARSVGITDGRLDPHERPLGGYCLGSNTKKCGDPDNCTCSHGCDIP